MTDEGFRVRVENLRLPANVPAGLNVLLLAAMAHRLRGTVQEVNDPILVRAHANGGWQIVDGRHRFIAAVIAGRADVLCKEEGP